MRQRISTARGTPSACQLRCVAEVSVQRQGVPPLARSAQGLRYARSDLWRRLRCRADPSRIEQNGEISQICCRRRLGSGSRCLLAVRGRLGVETLVVVTVVALWRGVGLGLNEQEKD